MPHNAHPAKSQVTGRVPSYESVQAWKRLLIAFAHNLYDKQRKPDPIFERDRIRSGAPQSRSLATSGRLVSSVGSMSHSSA